MNRADSLREWACGTLGALFDRVPEHLPPAPRGGGALGKAARDLGAAFARSARRDMEADQVRLFINAPGGIPAPPYASWYLDGELAGPSSRYAAEAYAREGLIVAAESGEPPDVIGAELEFLRFLGRHELAARATNDADALTAGLDAQRRFVSEHFARWIPPFVAAVRSASPGPVYAAAVTLLEEWVRAESARLRP